MLKIWGEGLASICFRVSDIAKMHRRLDRLALKPDAIADVESRDADSGKTLNWKRTRAATEATRGVRMFFLELPGDRPPSPVTAAAPITGLDHVVISTEDPERAAALYGARLGLDMALDRSPAQPARRTPVEAMLLEHPVNIATLQDPTGSQTNTAKCERLWQPLIRAHRRRYL